ncbi:hypothetical protein QFZ70_003628 [Arthrobacter sp. V1I9]|nr:hypothetical protein [Arthrobacter sp. V1I9]
MCIPRLIHIIIHSAFHTAANGYLRRSNNVGTRMII